jgi:phosphopantothenoylcysteine decarboxylase / phosphopantothenate---cysteine ligase
MSPTPPGIPVDLPLGRGHLLLVGTGSTSVAMLPMWIVGLRSWYACSVRVCLTYTASLLVSPGAVAAASGSPVWGPDWHLGSGTVAHKELAEWADLVIVAPATANFVAKCAYGMSDNLAVSTVMSAACPVVIAPSIASEALRRPSVRRNLEALADEGYVVLPTQNGISTHGAGASAGTPADLPTILRTAREVISSTDSTSTGRAEDR